MIQQFSPAEPPPVIKWYKIYCIAMIALYLLVVGIGIFLIVLPQIVPDSQGEDLPPTMLGLMYIVMGAVFMVPYIIAMFLPAKPWVWIYGMVMICISMTSGCCLPAAIPLLIYWIKPDVKRYFGRPE